jgi:hypothetical protein
MVVLQSLITLRLCLGEVFWVHRRDQAPSER